MNGMPLRGDQSSFMIRSARLLVYPIAGILAFHAVAQEKPEPESGTPPKAPETEKKEDPKAVEKKAEDRSKEEKPKESKGSVTIAGTDVHYATKTGTLPLLKDDGSGEKARIFFVYYAAVDGAGKPLAAGDPAKRPITFCFNGGPGSSGVWLQFGGLGPKKVEFDREGLEPSPHGPVVANPQSILDATDLVFIDPVGTGASRPAKGEKGEQFWGVNSDIESVGEFIRSFTTREQRWASPKFLCGESYGGVRGAGLCDFLQSKHGLYIDGFISISGVLNFATLQQDVPGALCFLPAYAATAHYHGKLPADLQADRAKAIAEARTFAQGEYASALVRGASLPAADRTRIAEKLARLTGLDRELIERAKLIIEPSLFFENLLRKEGKIIGRFDGRVTSEDYDQLRNSPEFDPSYTNIYGSFAAAANASIRGDLGYEFELPYRVLGGVSWSWKDFEGEEVNVEDRLGRAMKNNPRLRALFCLGLRDLAVPADSVLYSINHLPIPDSLRKNLAVEYYESGHMMYLNQPDAEKLRRDLVRFITAK
jgi:carboxypeptidase C (cathepsin A)